VTATDPRIERSQRLVREAALAELAEAGYGRFTIESVSARSGVARSTIYRHWPDKLTLIADALRTLNRQPRPTRTPDDVPAPERVRRVVRHLAEAFRESIVADCLPALIEGAEHDAGVRELHHRYNAERRRTLVEAIAAGVAAGDFADHIDPELAALALAGPIVYRRVMTGDPFDPDQVDQLIDLVLGGRRR
jgi:TetR/AcrR family transcriptional regulator, regulator of autoinduction and epiphytic fitness